MKKITFNSVGYFRFLVFKIEDQYFLFDIRPDHFIAHLFFPLNWLMYHKVYPISLEDYLKIQERYSQLSKFTIPTSLVTGAVVFVNSYTRLNNIDPFQYLSVTYSKNINMLLLVLSWISAYGLLQLFYALSQKRFLENIYTERNSNVEFKIKPEKPFRYFFSLIWAWGFCIIVPLAASVGFLYFKNLAFLILVFLFAVCYFGSSNGAFSPNEKWRYQIVDIKKVK